jgi:type IV pilus assembly protein PilQ
VIGAGRTAASNEAPYAPGVRSVSVVPSGGRAEIVIGVDASVDVDDFALEGPYRVVVDLKGAVLGMSPRYDRQARGGVTNVRAGQFNPTTVRVVIELDAPHSYDVVRKDGEVRITVDGGTASFSAWHSSPELASRYASQAAPATVPAMPAPAPAAKQAAAAPAQYVDYSPARPDSNILRDDYGYDNQATPTAEKFKLSAPTAVSDQPRITVTYQDADIRDVIAAFASFSGRTIVVGKDVSGTITAEIKNQPWDVALRAILQGQGLAAAEDAVSGIITVDSYRNIAAKQASEPLVTQMVAVNYAKASSLVQTLAGLLTKDCTAGSAATQAPQNAMTSCVARGAVAADTATNTLLITETPSRMPDLLSYVKNLDVRTPQVAIKAKIIFVNRTDIEELGLSYDLGTGADQFFGQMVPRIDPSTRVPVDTNGDGVPDAFGGGNPIAGDRVLLGGNALAAIANANARVVNPALKLVFSAALGKFQLTSFLDALQEVRLADLQAEPSIVTLDNRRAEILVGQEIPIRVLDLGTQGQAGAGGQGNQIPRATVQLKEVGIILSVTPHITNNRQILLDLHAENSDAQLASSDVGFIFGKQRADNQLLVADGQTAVIGGLTVTQVTSSKSGIPLLVDLPFIGRLFGTTRTSEQKRDLLILVTPHIIDEGERTLSARVNAPAAK